MKKTSKMKQGDLPAKAKKPLGKIASKIKKTLSANLNKTQRIIDAEAKYQALFESANDAIIIMDRDLVADCNQNTADMLLIKREEIIGRKVFEFWPILQTNGRNSREAGLEFVKRALIGDKCPFEWRHQRSDGTFIDTYITLNIFEWKGKKYLQAIIRDYSENKKVLDRLEEINKCWLGFGADPEKNINSLVALCGKELKADCALYNKVEGDNLLTLAGWNVPGGFQFQDKAAGHICTDVIEHELDEIRIIRDLHKSPYAQTDPNVRNYGLRTYIGKAVTFEKKHIGSICVVYKDDIKLNDNDLKLLGIITAAIGVEETRRHVIAELYESEERFRSLIANSPDMIFSLDHERRFSAINENISNRYGYSLADVIGRKFYDFVPDEDREAIRQFFQSMLDSKHETSQSIELCLTDKSRKKYFDFELNVNLHYDEKGNFQRAFGIARDITERKRIEENLHLTQLSVDNAADAVVWLTEDGLILNVNKEACRFSGYSKEELINNKAFAFVPSLSAASWPVEWRKLKKKGKRNFESIQRRKDGSTFPVEVNWNFIEIKGKELSFAFIRDITERKRLENQLMQAQKMEAIGTLAGGIAHDFNNLLMGIQGNTSLMLLNNSTTDPGHERLLNIQQQVQSGSELARQLLGFARGGTYNVKPTEIKDLVRKSADLFGRTKKEIAIHHNYQSAACIAEVDQVQIEQVLLNIFVNAWQAMPGGGNIFIKVENVALDEVLARSFNIIAGNYVKISIQDTGVGMDQMTMSRIFEPFFTTKEMGHGVGLGLASTYGITKSHKGAINVESEKGQGTTFTIYLPASAKDVEKEIAADVDIVTGSETVLLIDDEEAIIEVTRDILDMLGYKVFTAKNGWEAISIYEQRKNEIALIIMDMIMPGMGGAECFDALKKINPAVKVVLSSGYSMTEQAQDIMKKGCSNFIQKPFSIKELSQKIRETLDPSTSSG